MFGFQKILFIFLFISVIINASGFNIKQIQRDFYNKVFLEPLYNKYYVKSLEKACKDKGDKCYSLRLSNFMQKRYVKNAIKKRNARFLLDDNYITKLQLRMRKEIYHLTSSQFVTAVDLSKQVFLLLLWNNDIKTLEPIGFDFISSGNMEREKEVKKGEDHFLKTPVGFFPIVSGWRSKGKIYNDNYTMPYGKKDRFVFFFGKQKSIRYNTFKNGKKIKDKKNYKLITDKLNFAIHTHISRKSFGTPASHGCIRMSNALNKFLDNNLVFFKHLYRNGSWIHPYKKPPKNPKNYELAGEYMLVYDKL